MPDEAGLQFEKTLELDPNKSDAKIGISSVYMAQGNIDKAEIQLQKAIFLNPDPTLALYRLGQVYERKGDSQKAMEVYRDALERLLRKYGKN